MKLTLDLPSDSAMALRRMAQELDMTLAVAARELIRDWLLENGYLKFTPELDEESEVEGNA